MSNPATGRVHEGSSGRRMTSSEPVTPERIVVPRPGAVPVETGNYSLHHHDQQIALRSVRHDHAALEALHLLGARLVSNRQRRGSVAPEVPLTVYALSRELNLSSRRLQSFRTLPRPVSPDYLAKMRLPDRLMSAEHRLGDRRLPFLVFLAKVLNADDGSLRPHHEWQRCETETVARLLTTPPVEWMS